MPGRLWTEAEERQLLLTLIDQNVSPDWSQVAATVDGKSASACSYVDFTRHRLCFVTPSSVFEYCYVFSLVPPFYPLQRTPTSSSTTINTPAPSSTTTTHLPLSKYGSAMPAWSPEDERRLFMYFLANASSPNFAELAAHVGNGFSTLAARCASGRSQVLCCVISACFVLPYSLILERDDFEVLKSFR